MKNSRILVTGASRGIGRATALALLEAGHPVILHASSMESLQDTLGEAVERFGGLATAQVADLSDLQQVELMCRRIESDGEGLAVLVNNAALVTHDLHYSAQGIELQWAVNHLAGFYLANRLLPLLATRPQLRSTGVGGDKTRASAVGRIVQVSSIAHGFLTDVDFSVGEVGREANRRTSPYDHRYHYYRSKLANVLFVSEWARRVPASMVSANALHPGIVQTRLSRAYMRNPFFRFFESLIATSAVRAAVTPAYLACDESVGVVSGSFFKDRRQAPIKGLGNSATLANLLWETSLACIPSEYQEHLRRSWAEYERLLGAPESIRPLEKPKGATNE